MKVAYLHGLESNNQDEKNLWLRKIASDVYDPLINYRQPGIYKSILADVREFKPDVILGSSMGGYFAHKISKTLNIPAVLFNPALHSRPIEPDVKGSEREGYNPYTLVVFGSEDDVISPEKTMEMIDLRNVEFTIYDHGHRTPFTVFQKSLLKMITKI